VQPRRDQAHLSADAGFVRAALREAEQAAREDEVPVGAVIVHDGRIIGRGHNQREMLTDPTAHAEMIAITQAAAALESWRLEKTTLYVTLEPCLMCAGAIVNARIPRVVYGAKDPRAGACGSLYQVGLDARLNHRFEVEGGVLEKECAAILQRFFAGKRQG
jgi:tRNA(adenine34) deaminase